MNNNIAKLNVSFDAQKLVEEMKELKFRVGTCQAEWKDEVISVRDRKMTEFFEPWGESKRLADLFGASKSTFVVQKSNKELFWHTDPSWMGCCINFVIDGNLSPVEYENEKYWYESALLNVQNLHRVPAQSERRVIYKLCFENSFAERRESLVNFIG